MSNLKRIGWALLVAGRTFAGCTTKSSLYGWRFAEEKVVSHCTYIDTISENSDMGAFRFIPTSTLMFATRY